MARARMLKPDFFRDEELAELPIEGRMLFAGLWTIADRKGRLEYRVKRIKADIFPYDSFDVEMLLNQLNARKFITIYEVGESKYVQINSFCKHQHPHPNEPHSGIPAMPEQDNDMQLQNNGTQCHDNDKPLAKRAESESLAESESESESLPPNPPRARRSKSTSILAPGFLAFWDAWPQHKRKSDRNRCHQRWVRHGLENLTPEILASVSAWKASAEWAKEDGEYIPAPLVFINRRQWEAPPPTPPPTRQTHATDLAMDFNDVHTPEFRDEVLPE